MHFLNSSYLYLFLNIIFTVYSQIILKMALNNLIFIKIYTLDNILSFLIKCLGNFFLMSSIFSYLMASITWVLVLSKFNISFAYPFSLVSYLIVFILAVLYLNEKANMYNYLGLVLMITGLIFIAKN